MSFQQLDEAWVKAGYRGWPEQSPSFFQGSDSWLIGWPLVSTPIERRWFTLSRVVGRLEDDRIPDTLVLLEEDRPGCTSPCSENVRWSHRLGEESFLEMLGNI